MYEALLDLQPFMQVRPAVFCWLLPCVFSSQQFAVAELARALLSIPVRLFL